MRTTGCNGGPRSSRIRLLIRYGCHGILLIRHSIFLSEFIALETTRAFNDIERCIRFQVSLFVPPRSVKHRISQLQQQTALSPDLLEECIAQDNVIHTCQTNIIDDVPVNKEEHGKIDGFSRSDFLLLEAEAFHFGKVGCHLKAIRGKCQNHCDRQRPRG